MDKLMGRFSEISLYVKIKGKIKQMKSTAKISIKVMCYKISFNFCLY